MGKYIIIIILFLICIFIYYSLPPRDSEEELDENEEIILRSTINVPTGRYTEDGRSRSGNSKSSEENQKGESGKDNMFNEATVGDKRFRLYEKKRLNFKKADVFCRRLDGRLATTDTLSEMTKLQSLLARAKSTTDDIWMGLYSKKAWKKHAWRDKPHPPGINPEALKGMSAMMMGGGREEMCPALSSSTRASSPAQCYRELSFICEFDIEPEPKPTPPPPPTRPPGVKRQKASSKTGNTRKSPTTTKTKSTTTQKNKKSQSKNDKTKSQGKQTKARPTSPTTKSPRRSNSKDKMSQPKAKSTTTKPPRKVNNEKTQSKVKSTSTKQPRKVNNEKTRSKAKPTTTRPPKRPNTPKPKLYKPQRRKVIVKDEM